MKNLSHFDEKSQSFRPSQVGRYAWNYCTDSQSRFQFNSCLLCVCRLVSNKIQYTRSIIKSRFMINMNFSSTELFSDIHLGLCYILKQFHILYFANIFYRTGVCNFFFNQ